MLIQNPAQLDRALKSSWLGTRFCGDPGFSLAVGLFRSVDARRTQLIPRKKVRPNSFGLLKVFSDKSIKKKPNN